MKKQAQCQYLQGIGLAFLTEFPFISGKPVTKMTFQNHFAPLVFSGTAKCWDILPKTRKFSGKTRISFSSCGTYN
jgi:hypothetical protein